jgi:hypothetical protein
MSEADRLTVAAGTPTAELMGNLAYKDKRGSARCRLIVIGGLTGNQACIRRMAERSHFRKP